jgi:hypothetical protein
MGESLLPNPSGSANIDLNLCYDDTPLFRHRLEDVEKHIQQNMEIVGKSLIKQIQKALDLTKGKRRPIFLLLVKCHIEWMSL